MTIEQIKKLKESEDKVEFKEALTQYNYKKDRKSVLGYIIAFANEGGGKLILGVKENKSGSHEITGSAAWEGSEGKLKEDVYKDKNIRIDTEVLFDGNKRVLVIHIPSRPIGKVFKFEDVPLMRIGEDLHPMSDDQFLKILQEQEPDFSAVICEGLKIEDLDKGAIEKMKTKYADKKKNASFQSKPIDRILKDIGLMVDTKLTYAALILLAKKKSIVQHLPQARIIWEFRYIEGKIGYDFREEVCMPLFIGIDQIWNIINGQNASLQVRTKAYISPLQSFNEEVIREALLNAVAHRDYTITSEVVIKQYPKKIIIANPGGFPKGVTIDTLLTVSSTPRSRLMTEIMEKTGLVERSGQGVDKIFSFTLAEGKPAPSYKDSDPFQVCLVLSGALEDKAFYLFITEMQIKRGDNNPFDVSEIITLHKIKSGLFGNLDGAIVRKLEQEGLVKKGGSHSNRFTLPDFYNDLSENEQLIGKRYIIIEIQQFLRAVQGRSISIGDLETTLKDVINRNQIKYLIGKLYEDGVIVSEGVGRGTKYKLTTSFHSLLGDELSDRVISVLKEIHSKIN